MTEQAPATPDEARAELELLARRAGITLTEDDLTALASSYQQTIADLDRLRSGLTPEAEPAVVFRPSAGGRQS